MLNTSIKKVSVKNKTRISVSYKEFAGGIYVYRIFSADGKTGAGKVVIK